MNKLFMRVYTSVFIRNRLFGLIKFLLKMACRVRFGNLYSVLSPESLLHVENESQTFIPFKMF